MEDTTVITEDSIDNSVENTDSNSRDDMTDLLLQSPFAPLLQIDGVTPESLINSFASAFGDSDTSIDDSLFADGSVLGTDPFAGFGDPTAEGSPLTGGVNPWTQIPSSTGGEMSNSTVDEVPTSGEDNSTARMKDSIDNGGENNATDIDDNSGLTEGSTPTSDLFSSFGDRTAEGSPLTGGVNPWTQIPSSTGGDSLTGEISNSTGIADSLTGSSDSSGGGMPSFGDSSSDSSGGGMPSFSLGSNDSSGGDMFSFGRDMPSFGDSSNDSSGGGMFSFGGGGMAGR
ncbi:hypothetical protein NWP18_00695 [Chrysosporum ovalisporum ANA283AFssAo]|uniref:Uncharacterized protein n=1 Tax=Umezakia ovalisporum FSS-43 TaxID=2740520 RepID=A0ABT6K5J8_9CYAN|nr:hypothetical protein [Umezakia ovalisporum]MDH6057563.1 hypothetical protein [Umezakia ovalisporum FSS-43]MDH6101029.1 hypothetical protein [Umezakia ovalisporum ANA283AFssAo]